MKSVGIVTAACILLCCIGGCGLFGDSGKTGSRSRRSRINDPLSSKGIAWRYNEAGIDASSKGNHRQALQYFAKAVEADGNVALYYSNLGRSLYQVGQFDEALKAYQKAMDLGPADGRERAVLKANIGDVFRQRKNYEAAARYYHEALAESPGLARVHYELGNMYLKRREMAKAQYRLNRAIKLDPQYDQAILARAILYHLTYHDNQAWEDVLRLERMGFKVQEDLKREILRGIQTRKDKQRFQPAH